MILTVVQAPTEFELGLSFASILILLFLGVGGWVLKIMLTQPPSNPFVQPFLNENTLTAGKFLEVLILKE